jgi:4-amino-4-deoxy-L-arabinose transferase-like glycosyltransferase
MGFALLHAVVWTALPTLLYPNLPLDLIEALMYGREWQLGYDKLPPLPWWLVEIVNRIEGHDISYYLLAQISVIAAFIFVFTMARPLVGALGALIAVLFLDGLHYFNFTAVKFNHDVIQLPFWALAGLTFHRALRENRTFDWVLLGLSIGISLWAKYFVIVLAVPMALFVVFDPKARQSLTKPGPYIAITVAIIVMAPHLIWLWRNDFLPLAYAEHRAALSRGWYDHLWHPLQFAAGQLFFLIPSLLIAAPLFLPVRKHTGLTISPDANAYDQRIMTLLAFGPILCVLTLATISGRGTVAMWGYPLWLFLGPWLVLMARSMLTFRRFSWVLIVWGLTFVCFAVAFIIAYTVLQRFDHRYRAVFFPGESLAREISERYFNFTGKLPKYVIGTMWDGGNISHYATSHPRVLIDGEPRRAPWIDLVDLHRQGAVVVWTSGDPKAMPDEFKKIAAGAAIQPSFTLHDRRGDASTNVGWAVLSAAPSYAQSSHDEP